MSQIDKLYYEIVYTYGDGVAGETHTRGVIVDSKETREKLFKSNRFSDNDDHGKEFINGETNFYYEDYAGGLDERTGTTLEVMTYNKKLKYLTDVYKKELDVLTKLFEEKEGK